MFEVGSFTFTFIDNGGEERKKLFSQKKFQLPEKGLVLITGPSGSGKSTFLKLIKGLYPQFSSGELCGEVTPGKNYFSDKNFLYLFQNPFSQLIYQKPEEEFFFSMENFKMSKLEMEKKRKELSLFFSLDQVWGKNNAVLSNGECQKLVLASLMAINPKVLLLDEPTAFLDPNSRREFYLLLNKLKEEHLILIVDHHEKEINTLIDHAIIKKVSVEKTGEIVYQSNESHQSMLVNEDIQLIIPNEVNMNSNDIELSGRELFFGYDSKINIINGINFNFQAKDIIAIKGANGVGKSTLVKLMSGQLMSLKNGKVELTFNSKKRNGKSLLKETGFIFQNPESHFYFDTVKEEIMKNQSFDSYDTKEFFKNFCPSINDELSPFLLSEGEKRRLSIVLTLMLKKPVVIYDEPTFGQDENSKKWIVELMKWQQNLGRIQIFISHDDEFINKVATKVYELIDGKLTYVH